MRSDIRAIRRTPLSPGAQRVPGRVRRRFGRSTVADEVGADVAGGQFELAGFDDRELLAYETFGSGCHNGRGDSYAISFTQIKLIIHQLI